MKKILLAIAFVALSVFTLQAQQDTVAADADTTGFSGFLVPNYEQLGKIINDPSSDYYYPSLVKRFAAADTTLTIEEIHCLYYGYVLQDGYNPYRRIDEEEKASKILNQDNVTKKDAQKALKLLDKAVGQFPTRLCLYMYRYYAASLVYGADSKQARYDVFRFVALVSAIAASGDGTSFETALHVAAVADSYEVMNYFGLASQAQSLQSHDGQQFDVFTLGENDFELEELYVNVTPCLNYLSNMFAEDDDDAGNILFDTPLDQIDISVGRKMTVCLDKKRKGTYKFRVVKYEDYTDTVDWSSGGDKLFAEQGEENTIVFYCVNGKMAGKDCILLIMKSYCKEVLAYDSFIRLDGSADFRTTSNSGIYPNAVGTEMWHDPINTIRIARLRPGK